MNQIERLAVDVASDHGLFTRLSYRALKGEEILPTPFDDIINNTIDRVFSGEIKNLVVNMPPRKGKTLRFILALAARGFAINPASSFIHSSYSDKLVQENSASIRDIVESEDYRILFPHVDFRKDSNAKGLWKTTVGGSFLASSTGGSITGFGAGKIGAKGFHGCLLIDDPTKPSDARYPHKLNIANKFWYDTLRSRRADDNTPVIICMQRVHPTDFTHTIIEEADIGEVHHLVLPEYIEDDYVYNQSGIYIPHNLPLGSLWEEQHSDKEAKKLNKSIQHSQNPEEQKGEVYERSWFGRFSTCPVKIKEWAICGDTATKVKKYSDYSVFQLWGLGTDNKGYMFKMVRKKVEVPQLSPLFNNFYEKCKEFTGLNKIECLIEDKDSGSGLIQLLNQSKDRNNNAYPVKALQRSTSKYARALLGADKVCDGRIVIIKSLDGDALINESCKMKSDDSHKHDDMIDPMNDFVIYKMSNKSYIINKSIL